MTPREIIDKIKTFPARETANEKMIVEFALSIAYSIQQSVLNEMIDLDKEIDKTTNEHLLIAYAHKKRAYSDCFTIVNKEVESLEYYKENGNFGDL